MNKLFVIVAIAVLASACSVQVKETVVAPGPFTYIDCINLGNPEQFCRDNATP